MSWVITLNGLGPIKLGDRFSELQKQGWVIPKADAESDCWGERTLPRLRDSGVTLLDESIDSEEESRLIRISIGSDAYSTAEGARVGLTLEKLRAIYGARLITETKEGNGGPFDVLALRDGDHEIVFGTAWGTGLTDTATIQWITIQEWTDEMFGEC